MTFEANEILAMMTSESATNTASTGDAVLLTRAARMHELVKMRDHHFRRSVMADGAMGIMLSLFLGELKSVALTAGTLSLINMLDEQDASRILESLIQAGLANVTGEIPERRLVGLTALGSARMRSFVNDFPLM